jgi:hypothetical protein
VALSLRPAADDHVPPEMFRLERPVDVDLAPEQRVNRQRQNKKAVLIVAVFLAFAFLWTQGMFDLVLCKVHLNYQECGTNGFGATFCGDDLKQYNARIDNSRRN